MNMLVYSKYTIHAIIVLITVFFVAMTLYGNPINFSDGKMQLSNMSGYPNFINTREGIPRKDSEREKPNRIDRPKKQLDQSNSLPETKQEQTLVLPPKPNFSPSSGGSDSDNAVTKVKTPGFEVEISEGVSWMTVAKLLSILLVGYLGIKMTNFTYNKLNKHYLSKTKH